MIFIKRLILVLAFILISSLLIFSGCGNKTESETVTSPSSTQKAPGKYAESKYLGSWYNADANENFVCTLNDDGTAVFKEDKKATWAETATGITIATTVDGTKATMEGYFVIAGEGYVARATEANMHYLDEGGTLQLEIMLTENTCVDCVRK